MSITTCVASVTNTLTFPSVPACTITALAFVRPSEFSVETTGCGSPVGQIVRYPSFESGTTVTFSEYAAALGGTTQFVLGRKLRVWPAAIFGPPASVRVSTTRQGVTVLNSRAV